MTIAGRTALVHLASFAATEGDVWLFDRETRTAIVGDLVVRLVPFMDTACADGWSKALGEIAAVLFQMLIPGHGPVMTRADFADMAHCLRQFREVRRSTSHRKKQCVAGWGTRCREIHRRRDHKDYSNCAAGYHLETRLRSSPEEQQRDRKPLEAS